MDDTVIDHVIACMVAADPEQELGWFNAERLEQIAEGAIQGVRAALYDAVKSRHSDKDPV